MSTRSITVVKSRWTNEKEFSTNATIYRHHDGYLEGHGQWLFDFLNDMKVVNGITFDMPEKWINGPGRLAAKLVADLHAEGHSPGLIPEGSDAGQEYQYVVDVHFGINGGEITVTVYDGPITMFGYGGENCTNEIFTGTVAEYGKFLKQQND